MEVGGPDVICVLPASEDENTGPVSSSFSLRTKPQLPQTNSPLSSSLTKVPFFPQFGQLSGISLLSLSVGSWADDNCERLQCGRPLFTQVLPDGSARMISRRRRNETLCTAELSFIVFAFGIQPGRLSSKSLFCQALGRH